MLNDKARIRQLAEQILLSDTDSLDVLDYLLKSVEIIIKISDLKGIMIVKQSKKELYRDNVSLVLDLDRCRASNAELVIVNEQINKKNDALIARVKELESEN